MQDELNLPNELIDLSNVIAKYPESFTSGSNDIRAAALTATKFVFDIGQYLFIIMLSGKLISGITSIKI